MIPCPQCGLEPAAGPVCSHCGATLPEPPPAAAWQDPDPLPSLRGLGSAADFTTGSILGETFSVVFTNLAPFVAICALFELPQNLGSLFLPAIGRDLRATSGGCLLTLVNLVTSALVTAALTYGVLQSLRRRPTPVREYLRVGLSSLWRVLGVSLLQGLIIFIGSLLCAIPGILARVILAVAVPVVVEERPSVTEALERSSDLTDHFRWPIFFVQLAIGVLILGVRLLAAQVPATPGVLRTAGLVFFWGVQALVEALWATALAVMYYRLREVKESTGVEDIVSVFD